MKEVGRRVLAWETVLLGGWLGDGVPLWGKVRTHLDGGVSQAIAAARSLGRLVDPRLVEHRCCLGCSLRRRPSCVMARAIERARGDKHGRLGDAVLLAVVGLLEAALDGDHPFRLGILSFC